jgi:hypothetical protein
VRDVPADTDFSCDKVAVLEETIKSESYFFMQCCPISEKALLFERFLDFVRLSFRQVQSVGEVEYGTLVECCRQGKTKVLGEKHGKRETLYMKIHSVPHREHFMLPVEFDWVVL